MRDERLELFCRIVLPHLAAAHGLAGSLTANPEDAEDVVQEALLRAFRYFDSFAGGSARGWLLTIVRNTFSRWSETRHPTKLIPSSTTLGEIWLGNDTEETDPGVHRRRDAERSSSATAHCRASARIPRNDRASRAQGAFVPRNCTSHCRPDRHGHVPLGARPRQIAPGVVAWP